MEKGKAGSSFGASIRRGVAGLILPATDLIVRGSDMVHRARPRGFWKAHNKSPNWGGSWIEEYENIITNVGLDEYLDVGLSHKATTANWYVGLKDTGTPVAADTMASHASWGTISPYSDGTDPEWVDAGVSSQSVDNSGAVASFAIDATDEVFGSFLKDNNTVDSATGALFAVGDFAASRNVVNGDTLEVTATFTMADV